MIADESLRIGVYVCHCGSNIAGVVDVEELTQFAKGLPGVVISRHYKYMCLDPGQELVSGTSLSIISPAVGRRPARRTCTSPPSAAPPRAPA